MARGSWSHEDRDEEQLVEDSRWCQYRGLAAMQKKYSAARAAAARAWSTKQRPDRSWRRKADREAVSQEVSRRFTRSDDETRAGPQPGGKPKVL